MIHLPPRSWCEHFVKRFRDGGSSAVPDVHFENMFLGTVAANEDSKETSNMVTILHAVDMDTFMRRAVVGPKGFDTTHDLDCCEFSR